MKLAPIALRTLPLAVLALAPVRADVLTVDAGGGGDFTTIGEAVAAAQDGDLVLVKAGTYPGFVIDDESLVVEADAGAAVTVTESVQVLNLAADRSVALRGLVLSGVHAAAPTEPAALNVEHCAGPVLVQDCDISNQRYFIPPVELGVGPVASILSSDAVAITRSTLRWDSVPIVTHPDLPALRAIDSSVHLYDTEAFGAGGTEGVQMGEGASGVALTGSFLFASGSRLVGGSGAMGFTRGGCSDGGPGGAGLSLESGSPVAILLDSSLEGGAGGPGGGIFVQCDDGPPGPASAVESGTIDEIAGLAARRLTIASPVREGEPSTAHFEGEPGDFVARVLSTDPTALFLPDVHGTLLVEPVVLLAHGFLDAAGQKQLSTTIVELGLDHATLYEQAVFVGIPSGELVLSNVQAVTLLDAAF